jgi:prolyl 4-hydroxylase
MTKFEELWARAEAGDEDAIFALVEGFDRVNRPTDSVNVLWRAAQRGNALARLTLGARAIEGGVPQLGPADAAALIEDSVRQGNRQATEILAALISIGRAPGGMERALDMLLRSAELGSPSARSQLVLLTSDRALAASALANGNRPGIWPRLREAVDVRSLLLMPDIKWLSESPQIGIMEHFVDGDVCDWLIGRAAPRLQRSQVYSDDGGSSQLSDARTNSGAGFSLTNYDVLMGLTWRRIALAVGLPLSQVENFSVLHYSPGEEFRDHYDFHPDTPNYREVIEKSGNRILTFLIYLNDDYAGGETAFPRLGISHKGRRGGALFFFNVSPDGKPDMRTLHAGQPPASGEKWIVSVFVRDKPMSPMVSAAAG